MMNKVPYDMLETEGFDGLVKWYETLGIEDEDGKLDPTKVHVNEATFGRMMEALEVFYGEQYRVSIGMTLVNIGPSGCYSNIPDGEYKVVKLRRNTAV